MLKRKYRLRRRRDITMLFRQGQTCSGNSLAVKIRPNGLEQNRFMFVVSNKFDKRATRRNRRRRQLASTIQALWLHLHTGWDIAVIVRPAQPKTSFEDLQKELERCLKRLGVLN